MATRPDPTRLLSVMSSEDVYETPISNNEKDVYKMLWDRMLARSVEILVVYE